jgi:hypothetical protein
MSETFSDIDSQYSAADVSAKVEAELETQPKSATKTTSFYVLIATVLAGVIVTTLISMGWIPAEMKDSSVATFGAVIAGAMAWVAGKFIEGRSAVSVVKAQAAATRELAAQGISSPFGFGSSMAVGGTLGSVEILAEPIKPKRRKK